MKQRSIMFQLTLILFFVMAVPLSILTWYSDGQILRNSENTIAESSLAGLNANRQLNESALNALAQDTVRFAATKVFDPIRNYKTYDKLNMNYSTISSALVIMHELQNLNKRMNGVYSSYFYLEDSDYVVSTDKGITTLERYEPLDWIDSALEEQRGISGVWYPRRLSSGVNVVSYVLQLNRLTTTTRGTIVVNMRESQIGDYLLTSEHGKHSYFLLNADGMIISQTDKSLLFTNGYKQPFIGEIMQSGQKQGYIFRKLKDERFIYTWSKSDLYNWWNINVYSMDELMAKSRHLQQSIILLMAIIIFVGAGATVLIATRMSKPVRRLVRNINSRGKLEAANKNELLFIESAFKRMQEEEEELYTLLKQREKDSLSLAVHNLLRGEMTDQIAELFPAAYYRVAVISIDQYRKYVKHMSPETRKYHRYLLISQSDSLFPDAILARTVYHADGRFLIVMNYSDEEPGRCEGELRGILTKIREKAGEILGHTITIGVSSQTGESAVIPDKVLEAMEGIKQRMIEGSGTISFWKQEVYERRKYIYPTHSERHIINFLEKGDLDSISRELALIRKDIQSAEYITYDNIMFIYNQLIGVTIKYLRENNAHAVRIFAGQEDIYSTIAAIDTLDELEEYLQSFFSEIIRNLSRSSGEAGYGERITKYLEQHFCQEISFEQMAKEIGISYSYMRRIVYELTGKSLIDYTNLLRINKAKQILQTTNLTMAQIAAEVGYNNVQSFNRFFRKYEGMSPGNFRTLRPEQADRAQ